MIATTWFQWAQATGLTAVLAALWILHLRLAARVVKMGDEQTKTNQTLSSRISKTQTNQAKTEAKMEKQLSETSTACNSRMSKTDTTVAEIQQREKDTHRRVEDSDKYQHESFEGILDKMADYDKELAELKGVVNGMDGKMDLLIDMARPSGPVP